MKHLLNILLILGTIGSIALSQPVIVASGPASSTVTLTVIIPMKAKIVSCGPIAAITITAADIQQGSKAIVAATTLTIWSNASNGFILHSRLVSLKSGDGRDAAGILVLGKVGGQQLQPQCPLYQDLYHGAKTAANTTGLTVDYQLLIDPGTKPGLYQIEPEFSVSCL